MTELLYRLIAVMAVTLAKYSNAPNVLHDGAQLEPFCTGNQYLPALDATGVVFLFV
jgi:hypothetical protein